MKKSKQILLYLFFGIATTVVNWLIYIFFTEAIDVGLTTANALAWIGAVAFAFITNKKYVFESIEKKLRVVLREVGTFFLSRVFSGVFEIFLPTLLFEMGLNQPFFNIEGFWAKVVVSVIVVVLNYVLSKNFVFGATKMED